MTMLNDSVYADESEELLDALQSQVPGQAAPQAGQTQPETGHRYEEKEQVGQTQPETGHRYEENEQPQAAANEQVGQTQPETGHRNEENAAKPMTRFEVKDGGQAEAVAPVTKKCVMCMEEKPIEEFGRRTGYYEGNTDAVAYNSRCKKCVTTTTYMAARYSRCKDEPYETWTKGIKDDIAYVVDCYDKGGDINYGRGRVVEMVRLSGLREMEDINGSARDRVVFERKEMEKRIADLSERVVSLEGVVEMLLDAIRDASAKEEQATINSTTQARRAIVDRIRTDAEIFTKVFGSDESERSRFCDEFLPALFQRADAGRCDLTDIVGLTAPFAAAQTSLPQDLVAELDTATSKEFRERWYGFDDAQKAEVLSAFEECNLPNVYLDGFAAVNKQ